MADTTRVKDRFYWELGMVAVRGRLYKIHPALRSSSYFDEAKLEVICHCALGQPAHVLRGTKMLGPVVYVAVKPRTAKLVYLQRKIRGWIWARKASLAFLMAAHARLGGAAPVQKLGDDLLRAVCSYL